MHSNATYAYNAIPENIALNTSLTSVNDLYYVTSRCPYKLCSVFSSRAFSVAPLTQLVRSRFPTKVTFYDLY